MNEGKVVVKADEQGNVIGVSKNNPEYGYVRVQQSTMQINEQGWARPITRNALIKGKVEDLLQFNFKSNQVLPGKIVIKESLIPFNQENPDRDLKIAGDTGIICRVNDEPIYRQTFYTENLNSTDELIMHTNTVEIRDVQKVQREITNVSKLKRRVIEPSVTL